MTSRRVSRRVIAAALVASSLLGGGVAFAASLAVSSSKLTVYHRAAGCAAGTTTVTAIADSFIDQGSAGSNFGTGADLKVRAPVVITLLGARRTLVRFWLPATPDLCSVASVKLRLWTTAWDTGRTLSVVQITDPWSESGTGSVTWTNQPGTTGTPTTLTSTAGAGWREWTVTSLYSGGENGFMIRDLTGLLAQPEQIFDSRENTHDPELAVTFA